MFCRHCGAELQDGARFCPNCCAPIEYGCETASNDVNDNVRNSNYNTGFTPLTNYKSSQNSVATSPSSQKPQKLLRVLVKIVLILIGIFAIYKFFLAHPFITVFIGVIGLIIFASCLSVSGVTKKCTARMALPLRERLSFNFTDITIGMTETFVELYLGKNYVITYQNQNEKTCRWEYVDLINPDNVFSITIRFEKDASLFSVYKVVSKRQTGIWVN